jgi:hypothetical protein
MRSAGGRLRVTGVVMDKISMAPTGRRAFADRLQGRGGTLESLMVKLREKFAGVDGTSS